MKSLLNELNNGEVVGCMSMISPFFVINEIRPKDGLVISHGRRSEFMCLCESTLDFQDIAEVTPICNKERIFLEMVRQTSHRDIFVTDIWWLTESGLKEIANHRDKRLYIFVQFPNQIEPIVHYLKYLCVGPCDLALSNHCEFTFGGVNLQDSSLKLRYSANNFAEFRSIDTCGNTSAFEVSLAFDEEAL
ncbi:hypothetical protein VIBNIFTn2_120195 [Vibrio nigripulchritudo FTn2]|uniref:hypothetical protein n=1 Tax=Vibrio nigripulchritudo TaxID=28173 RepID=UPI0003B1C2E7|nr:hypothetical protein [Vibrio nigripulchritudo]CCN40213.1 hypothetical protein VIBNIFTn2_120195 [Vibrio nigripulchritudo FTn2]